MYVSHARIIVYSYLTSIFLLLNCGSRARVEVGSKARVEAEVKLEGKSEVGSIARVEVGSKV